MLGSGGVVMTTTVATPPTQSWPGSRRVSSLLWQVITPLHSGTGQESTGDIDLPVAREGGTALPVVPGSSIKGVFRGGVGLDQGSPDPASARARRLYGTTEDLDQDRKIKISRAGELTFTDARLLALAVPSYWGTFALATCPLVLARLSRDRELLGLPKLDLPPAPNRSNTRLTAFVANGSVLANGSGNQAILQDLDFDLNRQVKLGNLRGQLGLTGNGDADVVKRLIIVSDDVFTFLCATSLEVTAHIRLEHDVKTVRRGGLWYEESIPAESLLTSFLISDEGTTLSDLQPNGLVRLGGKSTVGRGLVRVREAAVAGGDGDHA